MSNLVRNPEDRFLPVLAQTMPPTIVVLKALVFADGGPKNMVTSFCGSFLGAISPLVKTGYIYYALCVGVDLICSILPGHLLILPHLYLK